MKGVFLGLGSNLGDRKSNIEEALHLLREHCGQVISSSSYYETEPWGFQTTDQFLNIVVEIDTALKPSGLLGRLLMIESILGRLRSGSGYTSRNIDIDILFYGRRKLDSSSLVIPHPKIQDRMFVLVPLCEIAPEFMHPLHGIPVSQMLSNCTDRSKVTRII